MSSYTIMLYPSREQSTIRVGKYNEAEFNMVWCTPGSFIIPSDFDLLLSISNEITTVFEYHEEKNESLGKKSSLSDFITLTKRRFAISLNLEVFNNFVCEDLIETNISKDWYTKYDLKNAISRETSNLNAKITSFFIIIGTPSKGFVTVYHSKSGKEEIHYLFHYWDCKAVIRANVIIEPYVEGVYPDSLVPKDKWPIIKHNGIDLLGKPETLEESEPPTLYYMTIFKEEQPNNV